MSPKFHLQLITLFFFITISLSINICSSTTPSLTNGYRGTSKTTRKKSLDFENVKSIGQKTITTLDPRLRTAEMNRMDIRVSQDGNGDFKTIGEAINSVPLRNTRRILIHIDSGVYREKVNIPRTMGFITLVGSGIDASTITGNDTASTARGRDGKPLTTFQSATVAVDADYFMAINIKFENTAPHVVGSAGGQAVALRVSGSKAAFYNCSFYGSQDTLYDHKGLHYFSYCFIQGSVDFIFGYGTSLYEWILLQELHGNGSGSIYLGRAWGDYSRVIFSYTFMDKIVLPQGWSDWGKKSRDKKVYYGEYKCNGAGANLTGRVPWARLLTDEEAMPFIGTYYVDGDTWLIHPSTYHL